MSVEQHFLHWYKQLFPDDQSSLSNFLRMWLNPQPQSQSASRIPQARVVPEKPVITNFLQEYKKLSLNEQQALCNFLRVWLNPHPSLRMKSPIFGGIFYTAVGEGKREFSQDVTCPYCKHKFKFNV